MYKTSKIFICVLIIINSKKTMFFGYARVSTGEQSLEAQEKQLLDYGCLKVFSEKKSGKNTDREQLNEALFECNSGDTLVVCKLDRLGRSLKDLINIIDNLGSRNINFISLDNKFDTTQATGKLLFQIVACFAEFERAMIRERTNAGLAHAKANGVILGRPTKITPKLMDKAQELFLKDEYTIVETCKLLDISRSFYYKNILPRLSEASL